MNTKITKKEYIYSIYSPSKLQVLALVILTLTIFPITLASPIKLTNFESFLKNNNLTKATLTNEKNHQWPNPWSKEVHSESLIELYEKSIEATLEAINTVNKYLYDNITITPLNNIFLDLSYDTGIPCNPKKRIYLKP